MKKLIFILLALFAISCTQNPRVTIKTDVGDIQIELYERQAPITVTNFLKYVDEGKYNGSQFYRVVKKDNQPNSAIKIEVIQGGLEFLTNIDSLPVIEHESTQKTGIRHLDGTVSMARLEPGTASSEFFICIGKQRELDYNGKRNPDLQGFAAFGRVVNGMDIVRKIQQMEDTAQYLVKPIKIIEIKRRKSIF